MKQSDIYITPFILSNPKGLYKAWKNDFAHVQYATTEGWSWDGVGHREVYRTVLDIL